ncbi:ABC transporter substrate-binding protein [Dactylosporangium sp. CA-233914]|uniref:ABC transporter substrate-binding protein n=1 Tax=Dactylosporangium sp. CA-233914 TaxID=3239934 RepID=UPI003D8FC921
MTGLGLVATVAMLAIAATGCGSSSDDGKGDGSISGTKVCMDKYVTSPSTADIVNGVEEAFKGSGIKFVVKSSEADSGTTQTIIQQFISDGCDAYMPVATSAAQATKAKVGKKPIVFVASSTPVQAKLVGSIDKPGGNVTGVSDPYPVRAEIDAMLKIKPSIKKVGMIWKVGDPAGDELAKEARNHFDELGIAVVEATIGTVSDASQAAQSLVGKVDAIELPGDTTTLSAVPAILKVAKSNDMPVFGAANDTVKAGGIVAGTWNYVDVGRVGGELMLKILRGADPATTPVVVPSDVELAVNVKEAERLGLKVPSDLKATQVG